jgi:hypothetical protein
LPTVAEELDITEALPPSELESGAIAEEFGVFSGAGPDEESPPQAAKRIAATKSKYLHFIQNPFILLHSEYKKNTIHGK